MDQTPLQPDEYVRELVERTKLTPDQARAVLQAQAEMASEYAERGFPFPGIGQIRVVSRSSPAPSALKNVLQKAVAKEGTPRPVSGTMVTRKVVFRLTQAGAESVLHPEKNVRNVFEVDWRPEAETGV